MAITTIPPLGADVPRGWTSCDQWNSAGLRSAMNAPALSAPSTYSYALDMTTTAVHRTGLVGCTWTAGAGLTRVSVSILPGGGWAVPDVATAAAEYPPGTGEIRARFKSIPTASPQLVHQRPTRKTEAWLLSN